LPANAGTNQFTVIDSVSCASAGDCSAVGTYLDSLSNRQGVLWTESSGAWATGVQASVPADAAVVQPAVSLSSVSCASAGDCSAVGGYVDSSGRVEGLLLTETAGTWATGLEAQLPADAGKFPNVTPTSRDGAQPDLRRLGLGHTGGRVRADRDGHLQGVRPAAIAAGFVHVGRDDGRFGERVGQRHQSPVGGVHPGDAR
jgi:hypothetical protein